MILSGLMRCLWNGLRTSLSKKIARLFYVLFYFLPFYQNVSKIINNGHNCEIFLFPGAVLAFSEGHES